MSSDISLLIVQRESGLVVSHRWIGKSSTRDRMLDVISDREPEARSRGYACYLVSSKEVLVITEDRYIDGLTAAEWGALARNFPEDQYAWSLIHDS